MSASEPSPTHTASSIEDLENAMLDGEFSDREGGPSGRCTRRIVVGSSLAAVAVCIAAGVRALSSGSSRSAVTTNGETPSWGMPSNAKPDDSDFGSAEPPGSGAGESHGGPGPTSEDEADATWYAECVDDSWPDVEKHCGSCTARVTHSKYNHTCDTYCSALGQYCAGAWEASGDGCDMDLPATCSKPLLGADAAVCQCVKSQKRATCASHRGNCVENKCCASITDSCFEKNSGWYGCRSSCAPGKPDHRDGPQWQQPWSCRQPHARPEAQARETFKWPDVKAVCSVGEVLVDPVAFKASYDSDCEVYCRKGAARGHMSSEHWISMVGKGNATPRICPGDFEGTQNRGVFCSCSFPDRL